MACKTSYRRRCREVERWKVWTPELVNSCNHHCSSYLHLSSINLFLWELDHGGTNRRDQPQTNSLVPRLWTLLVPENLHSARTNGTQPTSNSQCRIIVKISVTCNVLLIFRMGQLGVTIGIAILRAWKTMINQAGQFHLSQQFFVQILPRLQTPDLCILCSRDGAFWRLAGWICQLLLGCWYPLSCENWILSNICG